MSYVNGLVGNGLKVKLTIVSQVCGVIVSKRSYLDGGMTSWELAGTGKSALFTGLANVMRAMFKLNRQAVLARDCNMRVSHKWLRATQDVGDR